MAAPDFIGIGMERAGSSWLFYMLASHPDVWVPPIKELHYFDSINPASTARSWRYGKHLKARLFAKAAPFLKSSEDRPQFFKNSWLEYLAWDLQYFGSKKSHNWYRSLFSKKFTKGRTCGEITAKYATLSEDSIRDIGLNFPDTKIILSIRDPVERVISMLFHYFCGIQNRNLEMISEEEMLAWITKNKNSLKSSKDIVCLWQKYIKPENLILIDFNDLATAPEDLVCYLYKRLNLDSSFQPPETLMKKKIFSFRNGDEDLPASVRLKIAEMHPQESVKNIIKLHNL